jgi:hypothetical protein
VATRAASRSALGVLARWRGGTSWRLRARELLERVDAAWLPRRRVRAFRRWARHTRAKAVSEAAMVRGVWYHLHAYRAAAVARWRARAHTLRRARIALAALRQPCVVRCMARWRTYAALSWRLRPLMKRLVAAWRVSAAQWVVKREKGSWLIVVAARGWGGGRMIFCAVSNMSVALYPVSTHAPTKKSPVCIVRALLCIRRCNCPSALLHRSWRWGVRCVARPHCPGDWGTGSTASQGPPTAGAGAALGPSWTAPCLPAAGSVAYARGECCPTASASRGWG